MRRLLSAWLGLPLVVRATVPLAIMAAIWWLSSQQHLPGGSGWFAAFWHNGAHVFVYGCLSVAWLLSLHRDGGFVRGATVVAVVLAEVYAVIDELHQSYVPGRDASVSDACSDLFGAMLGVAIVLWTKTGSARAARALPWLVLGALGSVSLATWGPW